MNAIGYIAVFDGEQRSNSQAAYDAQKHKIEEYASNHGMIVTKWICDNVKDEDERPGLEEIIYGEIPTQSYEAFLMVNSDLISRDIYTYYYYRMLLDRKGIRLISIIEDFGDSNIYAPIIEAFTRFVAEMERQNLKKRTSSGRKAKALNGGYSGGRAPMGYKVVNHQLVINPEEAAAVRRAFELRDQGVVMLEIVERLNEEGYKTRSGKPFVISTVQSILNNRKTYLGFYRYGKDGEWVQGIHEPILGI